MASEYTTPEKVQRELRSTTCFSENTIPTLDQVREWILEESAQIDWDAGYVFASTPYVEDIDFDGQQYLMALNAPILSVTTLEYNQNRLGETASYITLTEDEDYTVYEDSGELLLINRNFKPVDGHKKFKLTYTAGYTTEPTVVTKLATKMVAERIMSTLLNQNVNEANSGGTIKVGSITIIDPTDVSVGTYSSIRSDIEQLRKEVSKAAVQPRYR